MRADGTRGNPSAFAVPLPFFMLRRRLLACWQVTVDAESPVKKEEPTTVLGKIKARLLYSLTVDVHEVRC